MLDRLGIVPYPVYVSAPRAAMRGRIIQRLHTYEKEANYLALSARMMLNGVQSNQQQALADGMLASRNWMLSVVMSHVLLQQAIEPKEFTIRPGAPSGSTFVLGEYLLPRAVKAGRDDGHLLQG